MVKISVPGSLLLVGEYGVTLPGGEGIAVAVDVHVRLEAQPASRWRVISHFEGGEYVWNEGERFPQELKLIELLLREIPCERAWSVVIDGRAFCDAEGRKRGFSSSAATALAMAALLLIDDHGRAPQGQKLIDRALWCHRKFQGERGSGYDLYASYYGGAGVFTGGSAPDWRAVRPFWLNALRLVRGERICRTSESLKRFEVLVEAGEIDKVVLLEKQRLLCQQLVEAMSEAEVKRVYCEAAQLNRWLLALLGEEVEQEAEAGCFKWLGAGCELGAMLVFGADGDEGTFGKDGSERLVVAERGIQWEW